MRSAQPKALSPAQVSPSPGQPNPGQVSPAQLTAARPKPWCGPCRTLCKGFSYRIQRSHFRPRDGSVFGAFLARLGPPCRCVWLFWRVHVWCVLGAPKCRPAEPSRPGYAFLVPCPAQHSPAQALVWALPKPSPPHLSPPQRNPAQPSPPQPSPATPQQPISSVQPKPPQPRPKPWCGPCQTSAKGFFLYWIQMWRFRLTGGIGFGPFLACWGRRAAAFRCLEA